MHINTINDFIPNVEAIRPINGANFINHREKLLSNP